MQYGTRLVGPAAELLRISGEARMTLPKLIRKPKRAKYVKVKRSFPKHRTWVRKHECSVTLSENGCICDGPIIAAHVRTDTDGGMGLKPHDRWIISLCRVHHNVQHSMGEKKFENIYGIDMKALAREFAAASPYSRELAE